MGQSTNLDIPKLVSEYLGRFHKAYRIIKPAPNDLVEWCESNLGKNYRDWFIFPGGKYDDHSILHILDSKWCTIFELKWGHYIR